MFVAAALAMGFTSCNKEENVPGSNSAEIKKGNPTTMRLAITMPSVQTYAADPNATADEVKMETINLLIYAEATDGTFVLEENKSLSKDNFTLTGNTYEFSDKIATTTGKKKIFAALNYGGTLPTTKGEAITELDKLVYEIGAVSELVSPANGVAMFSTKPNEKTFVMEGSEGAPDSETDNKVKATVKRLVAKVTAKAGTAIADVDNYTCTGGTLSDISFAIGNANTKTYAKQQLNAAKNVVDPNWSSSAAGDFITIAASDYKKISSSATAAITDLSTAYAPENTTQTFNPDGSNVTYISVRAKFTPAIVVDGNGAPKTPNFVNGTFYKVILTSGEVYYFDDELEADTYAAANGNLTKVTYDNGFCYYRAYLNKASNSDGEIVANKYDVLRNNYYKVTIKSISAPGTPADTGDIKENTNIDADIDIDPWTPFDEEFEL